MKKVLITGANSYIGCSFEAYVRENEKDWIIDTIDMRDGSWREKDFFKYDAIFHVAGIVHQKKGAVPDDVYYKVNCDLVVDVAKKAKAEGVKQFVFLSTMSVYGILMGYIDHNTVANPVNAYGKSKLKAEDQLKELASENFLVAVVRPPMIYGKGCKGNFVSLSKLADKIPVFPYFLNKRSMLYIGNLNVFIWYVIDREITGMLFPQDGEFVSIWDIVRIFREKKNKKIIGIKLFNPIIKLLRKRIRVLQKVCGDLCYEKSMSKLNGCEYQKYTLEAALEEIVS